MRLSFIVLVSINYDAQTPDLCRIKWITTELNNLSWDPNIKARFFPVEQDAQRWITEQLLAATAKWDNRSYELRQEAKDLEQKAGTIRLQIHTGIS